MKLPLKIDKKNLLDPSKVTIYIAVVLFFVLLATIASIGAPYNMKILPMFFNLLNDNAYLIVVSVGVTFVLLTGNIDISVASTIAFTCMLSAYLLRLGWNAYVVILLVLTIGLLFGALMGFLIEVFKMQSFIVTLAGMFFLRGMCTVISRESIAISDPVYNALATAKISFGTRETIGMVNIYLYVFIALAMVAIAFYVLKFTKFGRSVYAIGGNEQSARLMGLPVTQVKIAVYAISSFMAAFAGVLFSLYTRAGYALQNMGLELDAISSAVVGGTLLTGGVGNVIGTMVGVLIQGEINTVVTLLNLNSWWSKVAIAGLLCAFVILQRMLANRSEKNKQK